MTDTNTQAPKKKSFLRDWFDSIIFAVVVATIIRFFTFEAYTIPTPSMENSLLVGDYLFVSKLHYGAITPKTPLQMPLTHQKIWGTEIPSYLEWIQLPQFRLPGFSSVKKGDVVVFHFPPDSAYPADLRTNYVKRCIATAGDQIEIRDAQVYINGQAQENPPRMQHQYFIETNTTVPDRVFRRLNISDASQQTNTLGDNDPANDVQGYVMSATDGAMEELKGFGFVKKIYPLRENKSDTSARFLAYPASMKWNRDFYGPVRVPKKGETIQLDATNRAIYGDVITKYEDNKAKIENGVVKIDGKELKEYTFKQNYYFMMGDNRDNSLDSRFWGFAPEDHVVGKAVFVWLSIDSNAPTLGEKIRWSRLFRVIK